jgi:sphingomyelin phosphodiesterase acid-like 3
MISKRSKLTMILTCFLGILLLLPMGCGQSKKTSNVTRSFSQVSDIHFNPYYDPGLVTQLIQADANQWETIFFTSAVTGFGVPGQDETNYSLLLSSLQNMSKTANKPDFIIFSGDFLAHNFDTQFKTYAKPGDNYGDFVDKTITFVTLMFNKYLPGMRVYFCLGNNDSDTGDYEIVPDGEFLHDTAPVLSANFIRDPENQKSFTQTYPVGGYYTISPPGVPKTHIISLNSNFFSVKYVIKTGSDPGAQELDWLESQLNDARQHNDKVWLVLHIPPGANVFSTISKNQYNPMWQQQYNDRFIQILTANAAVITGGFAGHTHMDDFRVLFQSQTPPQAVSFIRICPAVSPQFDNNPGYQQFTYNRQGFSLIDYDTYWLNLEISNPTAAVWQKEYRFSSAYGQKAITTVSLLAVYNDLGTTPAFRSLYMNYYNVGNPSLPVMTDANFNAYRCGIGNWTQTDFTACSGIQ